MKRVTLLFLLFGFLCACDATSVASRLANGQPAQNIVPYHVHLRISNTALPQVHIGSGVLISQTVVLTVGLNVAGFNYWEGGVGSINLSELTWLRASGAILHDGYDPVTTDNNIAILIFGVGINVPGVVPATLPAFGANIPNFGDSGTLAGFGFTSSSLNQQTEVLLTGSQIVLSPAVCLQEFPELGDAVNRQFCGINILTGVTPCGGEEGLGFEILQGDQSVVVGLMSTTRQTCEAPAATTFYTKISDHRMWILSTIGI